MKQGGLVRLRYPHEEVYLAASPEAVRHVLVDRPDNYRKGYESLDVLLGRGVVLTEGKEWRGCRERARAGFSEDHLRRFGTSVTAAIEPLLHRWTQEASFDAEKDLICFTQDAISTWMFGVPMEPRLRTSFEAIRSCLSSPEGARDRRFEAELDRVDGWILRQVRRGPCGGALDPLLGAGNERQVRDEVMSLFVPGYETSSSLLSWIVHFLSRDPSLQERVRADPDERSRMIEETMRFYPPACSFARRAIQEDRILETAIPAGAKVAVSPYVTHHLPWLWPEPESFRPDRFLRRPEPYSYLPFGAGPRICIGARMAMMMADLVTSRVAARLDLKPLHRRSVKPWVGVTLRPRDGVWVAAKSRA